MLNACDIQLTKGKDFVYDNETLQTPGSAPIYI